jgi:hypothetical protein
MAYRSIPSEAAIYTAASTAPLFNLYVSTTGSDSNPGTQAAPFASIAGARDSIRSSGLNDIGNVRVNVAAGVYRVTSPISFTDTDTGNYNVTYRCSGALGSARILGTRVVTGWTLHSGSIYKAQVGAGAPFYRLWEDGVAGRIARSPKLVPDVSFPMARPNYKNTEGVISSHTFLQYVAGDYTPGSWSFANQPQVVIWSGGERDWFEDTIPTSAVDTGTRRFTLTEESRYDVFRSGFTGARYFIQGVLDLLTEAGEFFYDNATGTLYYWPVGNIATVTVEIPTVQRVFQFLGSSETARVSNITLDGLAIEGSDFTSWYRHALVDETDTDPDDPDTHVWQKYGRQMTMVRNRHGLVYLENADHITLYRCKLRNAGYNGVYGYGYNQDHLVAQCLIQNCGGSGIYIDGKYPGEGDVSKNNVVYSCKIHNVGELIGGSGGVVLANSGSNRISQLEIYNSPRYAVAIYAYTGITPADIYARDNLVQYVEIHDVCQNSGDTAAVYTFGLSSTDVPYVTNRYDQVTIDNSAAHSSITDVPPFGVFTDDQTEGQNFSNIEITNTPGGDYFQAGSSGNHTLSNVQWVSLNTSLMRYDLIGVASDFPY